MKYIILDSTVNHDRIYIDADGGNNELLENAEIFESEKAAELKIKDNNWEKWAVTKPFSDF